MYFITAMTNIITEETRFDSEEAKNHSTRCFGYFKEEADAISAVQRNSCDMWETCYHYAVIEKIEEGIHAIAKVVGWYQYNEEKDQYEPIEVGRTGFCNYAIG